MDLFVCDLCKDQYLIEFRNIHHKIPRSAGGKDAQDNLINLCVGCHQVMHSIAKMLANPHKTGDVDAAIAMYFADADAQRLCKELAFLIVKFNSLKSDGELDLSDREFLVMVPLPLLYHTALRTLANEHRDPDTGRKLGMYKYAKMLIMNHLEEEYPRIKDATSLSELLDKTPVNPLGLYSDTL